MPGPHALPEILAALESSARALERCCLALPDATFFAGDDLDWGPAQHLSHLALTHRRVTRGLASPESLPPTARGASRPYEELRETFRVQLAQVPPERLRPNPLPPRIAAGATQADLVGEFLASSAKLREAAGRWSEADCDARAMPHPFFGQLSAREMLLFVELHDRLHLDDVRRRSGGAP